MYDRRLAMERLRPISLLLSGILYGLLVQACSTETTPTDPFDSAPLTGEILGVVTADGAPASGVTVMLSSSGSEDATVMTDANGDFGFTDLDAGYYVVAISDPAGMNCISQQAAVVVPGEGTVVNFVCVTPASPAPVGTVEGRVTVNGVAARGVLVSISDASRRIAWRTSANDGTYRFNNVPIGAKSVWISTEEPCAGTQQEDDRREVEVTVSEEHVAVADFACTGQMITGMVSLDGIPQSGAKVLVCYGPSVWDDGCVGPFQTTDSEGRYAYTSLTGNVPPGNYLAFVEIGPSGATCPELLQVPVASSAVVTVDFDCEVDPPAVGSGAIMSVTIIPQSLRVGVHESQQLTAIVRDATGAVIDNPQVTFYSIGLPAGTVDSTGLVTGRPDGCGMGWVMAWSGGVKSNTVDVAIGPETGEGCSNYW